SRTVRDTAGMLDCVAGYEPGDPYTAPPPSRSFAEEVGAAPRNLRIGLLDHPPMPGVTRHAEGAGAVAAAGGLLESLGHRVEASHPEALEEEAFIPHFVTIVATSTARDLAYWEQIIGRSATHADVERDNLAFRHIGDEVTGPVYVDA